MNEPKQIGLVILILSQLVQININLLQSNGYNISTVAFTPIILIMCGAMLYVIGMMKENSVKG